VRIRQKGVDLGLLIGMVLPGAPVSIIPPIHLLSPTVLAVDLSRSPSELDNLRLHVQFKASLLDGQVIADTYKRGMGVVAGPTGGDPLLTLATRRLPTAGSRSIFLLEGHPFGSHPAVGNKVVQLALQVRILDGPRVYLNADARGSARTLEVSRTPVNFGGARTPNPLQK
jgi:hypothetical protein